MSVCCGCRWGPLCALLHVWSSEDNLEELSFSSHHYVNCRDQTQVVRLVDRVLLPSELSCWLNCLNSF